MPISSTGFWILEDKDFQSEHAHDPTLSEALSTLCAGNRVYDFGCGPGKYVRDMRAHGIEAVGYDGNPVTNTFQHCHVADLTDPTLRMEPLDFVMCLEVGEHVPKEYESKLLSTLDHHVRPGGLLVLSWAVPGQGGYGHVNCQTNEYVRSVFGSLGYTSVPSIERYLRTCASLSWFKNTLMAFRKRPDPAAPLNLHCIHLAHRTDRMEHLERLRTRYPSLQIEIVDGIHSTSGIEGCIRSHKAVIADAKAQGLPYVIVLEDDCDFLLPEPQLLSGLRTAIEYLADHPTVDIVNGCGNLPVLSATVVDSLRELTFLTSPDIRTTHCILYSRRAYDRLLAFPEDVAIDVQTNRLSMVFTYPYLATQIPSYSDIEHIDVAYTNIGRSQAFVQKIVENRPTKQAVDKRINPLSILRIPIRTNRM